MALLSVEYPEHTTGNTGDDHHPVFKAPFHKRRNVLDEFKADVTWRFKRIEQRNRLAPLQMQPLSNVLVCGDCLDDDSGRLAVGIIKNRPYLRWHDTEGRMCSSRVALDEYLREPIRGGEKGRANNCVANHQWR